MSYIKEFTPKSKEYVKNGHYLIEGIDFMSVYTFKKLCRYDINNDRSTNAIVTMQMDTKYGLYPFKGIMEIGDMKGEFVQLHKKSDLEEFIPKPKFRIAGRG